MSNLYLGRIVAIGRTQAGALAALYRVSSRSFPNRKAVHFPERQAVAIVPREGHEGDVFKNPYIAYNCARIVGDTAIVTNGSHTDPLAEKIAMGMPIRDALALTMLAMDYEKDSYDTPRISAVVRRGESAGWLAAVRKDGLDVRAFTLEPGRCFHLSTYEHNVPNGHQQGAFDAASASSACGFIMRGGEFAHYANPVSAVALVETAQGFEVGLE